MSYSRQPRPVDGGYEVYGRPVEIGDVNVNLADIEPLRQTVVRDFFRVIGNAATVFSDVHDITRGGRRIGGYGPYEYDAPEVFIGASLRHELDDTWRMVIMRSSFSDAQREDKKVVRHFFEVMAGNVLIAKKQARLKRGTITIEVDDLDGITETVTSSRKMYERAVTSEDCNDLQLAIGRAVRFLETRNR